MRVTFYPDEDALYFALSESKFSYGKALDDYRHLRFSEDDEIIGVEFLSVTDGVDLRGIPEEITAIIDPILEQINVKVLT
jgi:uncharacterized protein YuzE